MESLKVLLQAHQLSGHGVAATSRLLHDINSYNVVHNRVGHPTEPATLPY
jgi:hypothetical protein